MPTKPKALTEVQFLALLDKVLGKIMSDLHLRSKIQDEVAKEIRVINKLASFTKFAEKGSVADTAPETVAELQEQLAATFGEDARVAVSADEENDGNLAVEITLPDRTVSSQIKVQPGSGAEDGGESAAPFVPFPVTLPQDPELVWVLARRENLGADEAGRALSSIEQEFWASKGGQQRLRKGGERNFADFIATVPSAALLESGLKRHYKEPETLHALHLLDGEGGAPVGSTRKPKRPPEPTVTNLDHLFAPAGKDEGAASKHPLQGPENDETDDDSPAWD